MPKLTKTAPAFQLYASDTMADKRYRNMSLEERGLYLSILCECWVNRSMPADAQSIGKWLGFSKDIIEPALSERVLAFFDIEEMEITSPELERYRKTLEKRREDMSKGGQKGAEKRWRKPSASDDSQPINHLYGVSMGSRVEQKRDEKNGRENKDDINNKDHWLDDYEKYSEASGASLIPF